MSKTPVASNYKNRGRKKFSLKEEEKIIEFVKTNEVLYNVRHSAFRDSYLKNRLWLELANELQVDLPTIKKKWKSMRDYYVHSKGKKPTGSSKKSLRRDEALSFLDGTSILKRATTSNIDAEVPKTPETPTSEFGEHEYIICDNQSVVSSSESCDAADSSGSMSSTPASKKRKRNTKQETTNDLLRELILNRSKAANFFPPLPQKGNKVSKFFDSMAETVEKFSDVAIARTKMKIAQIVLEEEVKWAEEQEKKQQQQNYKSAASSSSQTLTFVPSDVDAEKSQEKI